MRHRITRFLPFLAAVFTAALSARSASGQPPAEQQAEPDQDTSIEAAQSSSPSEPDSDAAAPSEASDTSESPAVEAQPEEVDSNPPVGAPPPEDEPKATTPWPAATGAGDGGAAPAARAAAPRAPAPEAADAEPEYPKFDPSLRLMTGFERTSETRFAVQTKLTSERYGFFLSQARAQLQGKLSKRIELELSAELADAYDAEVVTTANKPPYLRDAFLNLRLRRAFQVTLGHFKRPMSALEHRNAGELQVRGRGLTNDLVIEDNAWGGRGLGMQLWGKIKSIRSRWAVGVFDPAWAAQASTRAKGADVLARYSIEPIEGLTLGVNGGLKTLDTPPFDEYETFYAAGGDVELEFGGLNFLADFLYAQLPQPVSGLNAQSSSGVVGLLSYDIPIGQEFALQPVALGEYADASTAHENSETLRTVIGLNLLVHETLRIMPQAEIVRWLGDPSELSPSQGTAIYLMVSLDM